MTKTDDVGAEVEVPSNEALNPQSKDHHILIVNPGGWSLSHDATCDPNTPPGCPYLAEKMTERYADQVRKAKGPVALKISTGKQTRFTEIKDAVLDPDTHPGGPSDLPDTVYAVVPADLADEEPADGPEATWPVQEPGEEPIPAPAAEEPAAIEAPEPEDQGEDEKS